MLWSVAALMNVGLDLADTTVSCGTWPFARTHGCIGKAKSYAHCSRRVRKPPDPRGATIARPSVHMRPISIWHQDPRHWARNEIE